MNTKNNMKAVFTDDFIFTLVMRDEAICRGLLERILPDTEFGEIRLANKEHPLFSEEPLTVEQQKSLQMGLDVHGVRFDVFAKASNLWAEIEMQTYTDVHIGKRSRYYHSNMDMDYLEPGRDYATLKPTYVIFICTFDYMGAGEPVYYFQSYDIKNWLPFDDERFTIVLNTKCEPEKVPDRLKPLFAYINNPERMEDDFIRMLDERVQKFSSKEWRSRQMTLGHLLEQAEARGESRGEAIGVRKINGLYEKLLEEGRLEDMKRAMKDEEFQKQLLEEFGL